MHVSVDRGDLIQNLERQPLRNIVLLKQLAAFPDHTRAWRVTGNEGDASARVVSKAL